jgi:hypothetical protein
MLVTTIEGETLHISKVDKIICSYSIPAYMCDRMRYEVRITPTGQRYLITDHDRENKTYVINQIEIEEALEEAATI